MEYKKYIVNIHIHEKILFYDSIKHVNHVNLISNVSIKYKVFNDIFNEKLYLGLSLYMYCLFNDTLIYKNQSFNNYTCYFLKTQLLNKLDTFYHFINELIHVHYSHFFYVQNNINSKFSVEFYNLFVNNANFFFNDITSINSLTQIGFITNENSFFLNKIFLSHLFLNV